MGSGVGTGGADPVLPWALPPGRGLGRSVCEQDLTLVRSAISLLLQTGPEPLGRPPSAPGWPCPRQRLGGPVGIPTLVLPSRTSSLCPRRQPPAAPHGWRSRGSVCVPLITPASGGPCATAPAGSEVTHLGPAACLPSGTQAVVCEEECGLLSGRLSRALPASGSGVGAGTYPFGSG